MLQQVAPSPPVHHVRLPWRDDVRRSLQAWPHVLIVGPAGSGKTTTAIDLALELTGGPPEVVQARPNTTSYSFWGEKVVVGGETPFLDGPLALALKHGRHLLVEEFQLVPPEEFASLLGIRGQRRVRNPESNEWIDVHPAFRFVATSNPEGVSCRRSAAVRQLLLDDFIIHEVESPERERAAEILRAHHPDLAEPDLAWCLDRWEEYRGLAQRGEKSATPISIRGALQLVAQVKAGMPRELAVRSALVNKYIYDHDVHETAKLRQDIAH